MNKKENLILVIDDEESIRDSCSQIIAREGHLAETAENGAKGLEKIKSLHPDMVLIDLKMPGKNGIEVLDEIRILDSSIIPVVITGYGTVESAVEAVKKGAFDFIQKPFTPEELRMIIRRGLEKKRLIQENEWLRREKTIMEENFVTMVSHQMRSPVVAVLQNFEVILAGLMGEVDKKLALMISRSSDRLYTLLNMINDWLDLAQMNNGFIAERILPFDITDLLVKLSEFYQSLAEKENVILILNPASTHVQVQGDRATLEQVFSNLITNAIIYNKPGGKVFISIRENGDSVVIEVKDTGIGIASDHLPLIFKQFYRVNRKEGQRVKGTGLGLSIAEKIVEAHRGAIHVMSELGNGSTFSVTLPKAAANENIVSYETNHSGS